MPSVLLSFYYRTVGLDDSEADIHIGGVKTLVSLGLLSTHGYWRKAVLIGVIPGINAAGMHHLVLFRSFGVGAMYVDGCQLHVIPLHDWEVDSSLVRLEVR